MTDSANEARALLEKHPWEVTLPLLVGYAQARTRHRWWGGLTDGRLPGGKEAVDVAYEAVEKTLSGTRGWDPAVQPDLVQHLKNVIESDLHHLAVGFENRRVLTEAVLDGRAADPAPGGFLSQVPGAGPTPAEAAIRREEEREARAFADAFLATLEHEPLLRSVVQCIFDGVVKPAEVAARIGASPTGVYNVRKRLQRKLLVFYARWGRGSGRHTGEVTP